MNTAVKSSPEIIYFQPIDGADPSQNDVEFCWNTDAVTDSDIKYVREDKVQEREVIAVQAAVSAAMAKVDKHCDTIATMYINTLLSELNPQVILNGLPLQSAVTSDPASATQVVTERERALITAAIAWCHQIVRNELLQSDALDKIDSLDPNLIAAETL